MILNALIKEDISELESLLIQDGKIQPVPYAELSRFTQNQIGNFCHVHAIYQIPTTELITFLKNEITDKDTIEIGAGNGCIGRALGIKMVDNYQQTWPHIADYYASLMTPTITYGEDVQRIDAMEAIRKYRPKIVLGCWVTQRWKRGYVNGNADGIDEELIFKHGVEKYIVVGNELTHGDKAILEQFRVSVFKPQWLISRSMSRDKNIIYIFYSK